MLKELLLALLIQNVPPGQTKYSIEPDGLGGYRQESAETAKERYAEISAAMVDAAAELLCLAPDGSKLDGCTPAPGVELLGKRRWTQTELVMTTAAAAIYESGLREDVMNGRGQAKHPDEHGGEGRGPGWEACQMQIHPAIAWRYADIDEQLRARAARNEPGAREAVAQTLLGREHLRNCFRAGMRMLLHSRAHCEWVDISTPKGSGAAIVRSRYDWTFRTFSMYGTGNSCYSYNGSKTLLRSTLATKLIAKAKERSRQAVESAGGKSRDRLASRR